MIVTFVHSLGKTLKPCALFLADIDECALRTHTCWNDSACINLAGGYDCLCPSGPSCSGDCPHEGGLKRNGQVWTLKEDRCSVCSCKVRLTWCRGICKYSSLPHLDLSASHFLPCGSSVVPEKLLLFWSTLQLTVMLPDRKRALNHCALGEKWVCSETAARESRAGKAVILCPLGASNLRLATGELNKPSPCSSVNFLTETILCLRWSPAWTCSLSVASRTVRLSFLLPATRQVDFHSKLTITIVRVLFIVGFFFNLLSPGPFLTLNCLPVSLILMEIKFCHHVVLFYALWNGAIKVFDSLVL